MSLSRKLWKLAFFPFSTIIFNALATPIAIDTNTSTVVTSTPGDNIPTVFPTPGGDGKIMITVNPTSGDDTSIVYQSSGSSDSTKAVNATPTPEDDLFSVSSTSGSSNESSIIIVVAPPTPGDDTPIILPDPDRLLLLFLKTIVRSFLLLFYR